MFVTMPHFEQCMPPAFVGEGHKYWRAVTLSSFASWYMVVYDTVCEGVEMSQTTLVTWEATLLQVLEGLPANAVRAVSLVESTSSTGGWTQRAIQEMWSAAPSEVESTGRLLIKFRDDERVVDATFSPVAHHEGRTLLFEVAK